MLTVLADHNIGGHCKLLVSIWESADWCELWHDAGIRVATFAELGLSPQTNDRALWLFCQAHAMVLVTANRNREGADSLEQTIEELNSPTALPTFTLADAERVLADRRYAERVAERLLYYLLDLDHLRGTGRLYVP